jgi:glycosyltransferase involved in cell wall biosynthesis
VRIVQYHPRALVGDGGITRSVRRLSTALDRLGADAVIAYDAATGPPEDGPVTWLPVPHAGSGPLRRPKGFAELIRGTDVLVINSAWTLQNAAAGRAARAVGVPYVLAPRGAYDPRILARRQAAKRLWWIAFERQLVRGAAAVHIFFPSEQSHLAALGYHGPALEAPNGVVMPDGARWDGGTGGFILYIGRFDPEHKGLDLLVRAVASLPAGAVPPLRLHGPDWAGGKEVVRRLVAELGVGDRVQVGEPVYGEEKWSLLTSCTGFVYPSRWEGFGNSLAEAAAAGVPSLATPYPLALRLAERDAAIVVDADVPALAEGLVRLSSPEAGTTGERAAAFVRAELTWDAVAARWLEQAASLAGAPHPDERRQ